MSGIPVAYEVNVDDLSDPKFIDVEINEGTPIQSELSNNVNKTYNMSRMIKFCTCSSGLLYLIYCIYNPYFLFPFFITITGWYGANNYSKSLSIIYLIYLISTTISRLFIFITLFLNYEPSLKKTLYVEMFIVILGSLINIWLILQVIKFITYLTELDDITIKRLCNGQIGNLKKVYVIW